MPRILLTASLLILLFLAAGLSGAGTVQDEETDTRMYPISDINFRNPAAVLESHQSVTGTANPWPQGGGFDGGLGNGSDREEQIETIIELITNTIARDQWEMNGGTVGTIDEMHEELIITATPEMHEQIVTLLNDLRDSSGYHIDLVLAPMPAFQVDRTNPETLLDGNPAVTHLAGELRAGKALTLRDGAIAQWVSNVSPVVAANAVGYQVQTSDLELGTGAAVLISRVGEKLVVDLSVKHVEIDAEKSVCGNLQADPPQPDKLVLKTSRLSSSLNIRPDQWTHVGSLRIDDEPVQLLLKISPDEVR